MTESFGGHAIEKLKKRATKSRNNNINSSSTTVTGITEMSLQAFNELCEMMGNGVDVENLDHLRDVIYEKFKGKKQTAYLLATIHHANDLADYIKVMSNIRKK